MRRPDLEREIAAAVEARARRLVAAGVPVERAELVNEGWRLALEALPHFDPDRGTVGAYLWPILRAELGKAVARFLSPITLSDQAARAAAPVELGAVDDVEDVGATPEQLVAEAEARARAFGVMADVVADMGARAAAVMAEPIDALARDVGARVGVSAGRVREVRWTFRDRVRQRLRAA